MVFLPFFQVALVVMGFSWVVSSSSSLFHCSNCFCQYVEPSGVLSMMDIMRGGWRLARWSFPAMMFCGYGYGLFHSS